jgi:hypothetical protein
VAAAFELPVQIIQQQIGEQRRQWAAPVQARGRLLRRALVSRGADAMLHHPRRQKAADDPQQAFVADAPRQVAHHHIVIDPVEKLFEIQIDNNVVAPGDVFPGSVQRLVRAPSRAEAKARSREARIEQRLQDLQDRLLDQAIDHRGNAQLALAAARLGDFHPAHWLRLIAPVEQRGDQRVLVLGDPGPQVGNGHAVNSRRPVVRLHPLIGLVQVRRTGDLLHQPLRQGSLPWPRRVSLPLLVRSRLGSAEAGTAVAQRCLQGLVKEVQLLTAALLPRRCHRVALVCSPAFAGAGSWLRDSALRAGPTDRRYYGLG